MITATFILTKSLAAGRSCAAAVLVGLPDWLTWRRAAVGAGALGALYLLARLGGAWRRAPPPTIPGVLGYVGNEAEEAGAPAVRLVVSDGVGEDKTFVLRKEVISIGRSPQSDLVLPDLSRNHARIRTRDGGDTIEDLESTNGTYLNGWPVRGRVKLADGNVIQVGKFRIKYSRA